MCAIVVPSVVGDVAALVYEVQRSDSDQFLCVPLPSGKHRRRCDRTTMLGIDDKPTLGIDGKCNSEASTGLNESQMLLMSGSQATEARGSLDKSKGLLGGGKSFGSKML
jgi:hypothetical protein